MSLKQESPSETIEQSAGCDPKSSKRNSGLFSFLKWFKPSTSRESIDTSRSSSCDSLNSIQSNGTVASFSYVPPSAYVKRVSEKCIVVGPETDTYKARLRQRDKRREKDKNLTLRKKYNLFFNRDSLLRPPKQTEEENTKSLPLMNRTTMEVEEEVIVHRRTNSESSKLKKAGAYLHVKGKRRAPQPPGSRHSVDASSTTSLKRKKRVAPHPPPSIVENNSSKEDLKNGAIKEEIICNDYLKLDHGVLKPVKGTTNTLKVPNEDTTPTTGVSPSTSKTNCTEAPVSPRLWYKRTGNKEHIGKKEQKQEPSEVLPEVPYNRNSTLDLTLDDVKEEKTKKDDKRKSGLSILANISELDREASEIIRNKEQGKNGWTDLQDIPEFMRPKETKADSLVSPKRRSARDLIAKFNAITNVTKVTVFGASQKDRRDYFGKSKSVDDSKRQETLLESHKRRLGEIDKKREETVTPLMKSESASAIKPKLDTPKSERKSWKCSKCNLENEYWRIICHVCSAIKPYFDDFASSGKPSDNKPNEIKTTSPLVTRKDPIATKNNPERLLERSRTQIGFSALVNFGLNNREKSDKTATFDEKSPQKDEQNKKDEKEKLKKMLIEMKNSLPKRKSNILMKQNSRTSIIMENPENNHEESMEEKKEKPTEKSQEEKVAEILIGSTQTIYENIKVRKVDTPKPTKITSTTQKGTVVKNIESKETNNFELMKPKDFEDIYSEKNGPCAARIYSNLARNDELSLFFNVPKRITELKNSVNHTKITNTDTIEINRLLRRLETAIAKGDLTEAACFAKELAQLKVNCSVVRQKPQAGNSEKTKQGFQIDMFVEDKISHRGPFPIDVTENQTVEELKKQVEKEFEIPVNVQTWILGKELVTDEKATLKDHKVIEGCPVFLYLVAPDSKNKLVENKSTVNTKEAQNGNSVPTKPIASTSKVVQISKDEEKPQSSLPVLTNASYHTPKIVNVIPKQAEAEISTKNEVRIIPTQIDKNKDEIKLVEKPVSTAEIKIEKPVTCSPSHNKPSTSFVKNPENYKTSVTATEKSLDKSRNVDQKTAPLAEDLEDYDIKTLKPQKEWECHLCTLLNPTESNICAVCATVRLNKTPVKKSTKKKAPQPKEQTYLQLVNLDNADLVENVETFECVVCFLEVAPHEGVTLRECLHQFCRPCLANTIEYADEAEVKCPYRDDDYSCNIALQDREIKALVSPNVYDQHLAKSVAQAENKMDKTFHCKTPDCKGWCIFEDNVNEFKCPVCRKVNCLTCQAVHNGLNCKQYQERMTQESEVDEDAKRTKEMLREMVEKGEALTCPTCKVILMKKWGCDWLRCSMCKTEICWVTRGPRWGPGGKGDTSGGCQCGVNGVKCHPQCNYCH